MPTMSRPARAGEPAGCLSVHTPEEVVHADRSADGSTWVANVRTGTAVRAMLRKGWAPAAPAKVPGRPHKVAAVRTPTKAPAKPKPKPRTQPAPCLDVLDLSVAKLEEELESGKHDSALSQLLAAEEGGKTRKGAVKAIKARQDAI